MAKEKDSHMRTNSLNVKPLNARAVNKQKIYGLRKDCTSSNNNADFLKNKHFRNFPKKIVHVFQVLGKKNVRNINDPDNTLNKITKKKPRVQRITTIYLKEREWFKKKFERDICKSSTGKETSLADLERYLRYQELIMCPRSSLYKEFVEKPRPDNIPDVVWRGPLMRKCGCPLKDCECRGHVVLPPQIIPFEIRYTWRPKYYLRALRRFKSRKPENNFAQRLLQSVEAESYAYRKLDKLGALEARGPEFCIEKCFHYYIPEARPRNSYFKLKKQILDNMTAEADEEYDEDDEIYEKTERGIAAAGPFEVEKQNIRKGKKAIDDKIIDGYYTTEPTQAMIAPNGEFIMGKVSHILFGRVKDYNMCDIEGKKINVCCYEEPDKIADPPTITSKLDKIFSFKGITCVISKLTNNLFTSIIEIKDTGIPVNTQATQDPPLDDDYQAIIEILPKNKLYSVGSHDAESCPCCNFYETSAPITFEEISDDDFQAKRTDSKLFPYLSLSTTEKKNTDFKFERPLEGNAIEKIDDSAQLSPQRDIPQDKMSPTETFVRNEAEKIGSSNLVQENQNIDLPIASEVTNNKNNIVEIEKSKYDEKLSDKNTNKISSIDQNVKASYTVTKINNSLEMLPNKRITISSNIGVKSDEKIFHEKLQSQISKINMQNVTENYTVTTDNKETEMLTNLKPTSKILSNNDIHVENKIEKKSQSNVSFKKFTSQQDRELESNEIPEKQIPQISNINQKNIIEKDAVISKIKESEMVTNLQNKFNETMIKPTNNDDVCNENNIERKKQSNESFEKSASINQDKRKGNDNSSNKQITQNSRINPKNVEENAVILQKKGAEMWTNLKKKSADIFKSLKSSTENTKEEIKRSKESFKKSSSVNQDNDESIINAPKKYATESSKTDVRMLLDNKHEMKFHSTQKPSVKSFVNKNSERVSLRGKIRNVFSYEHFKLHVKKSFQKTSSAFSTFFKCLDFKSAFDIRNSKDNKKEHKPVYIDVCDDFVKESDNSDRKDSKISEEEMFSLQYTSTLMSETNNSDARKN